MDKHSYSYEQYCSVVNKNIIILETSYYDGNKKIKCLNLYKCKKEFGGCKINSYWLNKKTLLKKVVNNYIIYPVI